MRFLLRSLWFSQLGTPLVLLLVALSSITGQVSNAQDASSSQIVGVVIDAQGAWCDQLKSSCRDLFKMYPVAEVSKLVPKSPLTQPRSVTIRFRTGARETFDCFNPRELGCQRPLDFSRFKGPEQSTSVVGAFLHAVMELAGTEPKVYDSLRQGILQSRGPHPLSDGVAENTAQGVDLRAVLASLPPGEYLLELCPLNDAQKPACSKTSDPVDYAWNPEKPVPYRAPSARPGMYRLYRWDNSAGSPQRSREFADVLLADSTKFPALSQRFAQVVATTRNWDANDPTAPALRRGYLYTLARQ